MKNILLLVLMFGLFNHLPAQELFFIPCESYDEINSLNKDKNYKVHLFGETFVIATGNVNTIDKATVLDVNPWSSEHLYTIVYIFPEEKYSYSSNLPENTSICFESEEFLILKHLPGEIFPARNDGAVRITPNRAHLADGSSERFTSKQIIETDPFIQSLINEINIDSIHMTIQDLENYGTRFYNKPEAFESEQWIKEQFESLGLDTQIHTFPEAGSSGNIIAIHPGTLFPDEFVICGAHYDSYNNIGNYDQAPGADDNATGVASILEAARILSQYDFDRSIIFCAWAAEEIGLVGSQYYAEDAAADEMDILAYFNLDMTGYLDPTQNFKFVLHYSHNSEPLRDYYINMVNLYYPNIPIEMSFSQWGSDYASFANNGYMAVSQNEDWSHANPHYHSETDLIGPSVNNFEQVETYAGLNIASVASLAKSIEAIPLPPANLTGMKGDQEVFLTWEFVNDDILYYNVFRDNELIDNVDPSVNSFNDTGLENETIYTYFITAKYTEDNESGPSNEVELIPMPEITFPFFTDFEDLNIAYWDLSEYWGIASNYSYSPTHSLSTFLDSFYENNLHATCSLDPITLPENNLEPYLEFQLSIHLLEDGDGDFVFLEVHAEDEEQWTILDTYTGIQPGWQNKQYSLDQYSNQKVYIRFRMETDEAGQNFGVFIDDFFIDFHTSTQNDRDVSVLAFPNPSTNIININYLKTNSSAVIINNLGQKVFEQKLSPQQNQIDISSLDKGIYYIQIIEQNQKVQVLKIVKN